MHEHAMSSDAQSNYAKSLGKLLEQAMLTQQGQQGQTPSSCLMVELCKQNQRLRDLHAALAAATFGAARLSADAGDEEIIALLASVGQSARVSGMTLFARETTLAGQSLRPVHRWGSAVRPAGQMTLDPFAVAPWREALLAGQPVVGGLATFDAEAKLALVSLGIHSRPFRSCSTMHSRGSWCWRIRRSIRRGTKKRRQCFA
mgnify:CR=1 FL=1